MFKTDLTAIGATLPVKVADKIDSHTVYIELNSSGTTKITAATVLLQGGSAYYKTCLNTNPTLAVGSTAQNIRMTTFYFQINGTNYTKATDTVGTAPTDVGGTAITAAITGSKYGGLVVCVSTAGALRCIAPDYQLATTQAYDSAALCNAALDAVIVPSGFCYIGKLVVTAAGGGFTFGTTALTTVTTFYDGTCPYDTLVTHALDATELTNQRGSFDAINQYHRKYMRMMLSALTGAGTVTLKYEPREC
jgi:hypothetical protein